MQTCKLVCAVLGAAALAALPLAAELDYGNYTSETLTSNAWKAVEQGAYDDALAYTAMCIEKYEEAAHEMQASLDDYPVTEPREETFQYWALNDVGTCYFIRGEIFFKQGKLDAAKTAYGKCAEDFKYAQCWDPKGWFWKPGAAARQKLVEIEFDEE
jgi:tetratricopeptide (TPR) repeat protein